MAGLLQQPIQAQAPQAPQPAPIAPPPADNKQDMEKVNRLVLAAQKVMYSKQTNHIFMEHLAMVPGDATQKAGNTAAFVMVLVKQQIGKLLDPRLFIPAGIIVVSDILDFISKTTNKDTSEDQDMAAVEVFIDAVKKLLGGEQQAQPVPPQGAVQ